MAPTQIARLRDTLTTTVAEFAIKILAAFAARRKR
jgi:hypothetical protein